MNEILKKADYISTILKNLSNKDKLAILCYLSTKEKNVSEIIKFSNLSQSQVSQFLNKMKLEWILESKKIWKEVYYKISDPKILQLISSLKIIFW